MEHTKTNSMIKMIAKMIVRIWLIFGEIVSILYIVWPVRLFPVSLFFTIAVCYGIIGFFIRLLEQKYWPDRETNRISKFIGIIMVLMIIIKGFLVI